MSNRNRKSRKSTTTSTTFTRAEFQLLVDLVEREASTPLADINASYRRILLDLQARLEGIAFPDGGIGVATDAVEVAS